MLVYVNYYGKGYSKTAKQIMNNLKMFKVKSRTNPSWPGTPGTCANNTSYKVVFYRNTNEAKEILKQVNCLSDWSYPAPQDLAFFKGEDCWFYSVGHEKIGAIIGATQCDFDFLELNNLAKRSDAKVVSDYYEAFNENLGDNGDYSPGDKGNVLLPYRLNP